MGAEWDEGSWKYAPKGEASLLVYSAQKEIQSSTFVVVGKGENLLKCLVAHRKLQQCHDSTALYDLHPLNGPFNVIQLLYDSRGDL